MHSLDGNFQPADASKVPIFRYLYNFKPIEKICVKKLGNKDKNFRRSSTLNCIYLNSVVITRCLEVKNTPHLIGYLPPHIHHTLRE